MDQPDNTDPTESIERTEPRESIERTQPSPPIERTEPTEPIERTEPSAPIDNSEPLLPMHSIDPSDHNDHRDSERGLEVMRPLSRDRSFTRPGQASEAAVFRTAPPPALDGWGAGASRTCERGLPTGNGSWPVEPQMWEAPVSHQRTSVGLDVHARSVVACALVSETGEVVEHRLCRITAKS